MHRIAPVVLTGAAMTRSYMAMMRRSAHGHKLAGYQPRRPGRRRHTYELSRTEKQKLVPNGSEALSSSDKVLAERWNIEMEPFEIKTALQICGVELCHINAQRWSARSALFMACFRMECFTYTSAALLICYTEPLMSLYRGQPVGRNAHLHREWAAETPKFPLEAADKIVTRCSRSHMREAHVCASHRRSSRWPCTGGEGNEDVGHRQSPGIYSRGHQPTEQLC